MIGSGLASPGTWCVRAWPIRSSGTVDTSSSHTWLCSASHAGPSDEPIAPSASRRRAEKPPRAGASCIVGATASDRGLHLSRLHGGTSPQGVSRRPHRGPTITVRIALKVRGLTVTVKRKLLEINDDGSQAESHHEQSCGARCVVRRAGRWRVERPCAWALLHGCSFLPFGCALGCGMCVCMRPPDWFCGMACQFGRRRRPCAPAWRRASARWAPLSTLLVSCAAAIGVTVEA